VSFVDIAVFLLYDVTLTPILMYRPTITAAMENKLMAYQFALRLRCENYACDVEPIATDLQLPPAK
jgi:hypothetical protein